jgi:lauroyl/myristoyl acyltransferase
MDMVRTGDRNRDLEVNTRRFNEVLEQIIREQPDTWLWGHKRWKYQPDGNPQNLYALSSQELVDFLKVKRMSIS